MNLSIPSKDDDHYELNELLRRIVGGNAVLFLGSGFSADARGVTDEEMPLAGPLANAIGELGHFDGESDLRYAADRYIDENDPRSMVDLLRQKFTVKTVGQHHRDIASVPWRCIYTTNYDLCIERAASDVGKIITTVDVSDSPASFTGMSDICVHLNGSLKNLSTETLNSDFKLSTASYLSPESFLTSLWHFPFQRDLEFSSAIVFVGYSMYDIEIQKILHLNAHYAEKTYFITRKSTNSRSTYTLSKYGKVLPIETKGFGLALSSYIKNNPIGKTEFFLTSLWHYESTPYDKAIRDSDVDSFLMRGDIADSIIDASHSEQNGSPILINRVMLKYAKELLYSGANIAVIGDFGNGKSVFIRQLRSLLTGQSFDVYTADHKDIHQHDDLDKLIKSGVKAFLVVDSYEQNMELVQHFAEQSPPNIQLILGARTNNHERCRKTLLQQGLNLSEVAIDDLEEEDVREFINIVSNAGYWGDKAAISMTAKRNLVIQDYRRHLSLNLLGLLESPQMVNRVQVLLTDLIKNKEKKDTIFAIALLSIIDFPLTSSLISDVAMNPEIYSSELRSDENFSQLFHIHGSLITTKSSLFALAMITHQFTSTYIVDQLLKIVEMLGDTRSEVQERKDIQKSLLRFSVVERLLPEKQKKNNLVRYYEQVKLKVSWLQHDPHFWLQYGMSQITYKEYEKAQDFFKQAYALASRRDGYHTIQIDTQQARLYLLRSLESQDNAQTQKYFADANQLIRKLPNDSHTYRQVELYRNVFEQNYPNFSGSSKAYFEQACRAILQDINNVIRDQERSTQPSKVHERVKRMLEKILDEVKTMRVK